MPTPRWLTQLKYDPTQLLLSSGSYAIEYFTRRDLLDEVVEPITSVWQLTEVQKIFRKQRPDGSWNHSGKQTVTYPKHHHALVETWKAFHVLVERYELTKMHEGTRRASEFLFSFQTSQGDIRGMIANQYATYYTGTILAALIKAGYAENQCTQKALTWLLSMRQNDGGWTVPILTHKLDKATFYKLTSEYAKPVKPDKTKPFSHNWTDMVLRAFAAHPVYRYSTEAHTAGNLLKSSFFQPDFYSSYHDKRYWVRFLFWWPNLVTALDSLSLMGYLSDDKDIAKGLNWIIENQMAYGLWKLDYSKNVKEKVSYNNEKLWLALRIARIFKRFYG